MVRRLHLISVDTCDLDSRFASRLSPSERGWEPSGVEMPENGGGKIAKIPSLVGSLTPSQRHAKLCPIFAASLTFVDPEVLQSGFGLSF